MTIDEFKEIDRGARLSRPKLFSTAIASPEPKATDEVLERLQKTIGLTLPLGYRSFLKEFGGGEFGLTTVFSANPSSEWYLAKRYDEAKGYLPASMLPFSDDSAGGLYLLEIEDGLAVEPVFYFNQDGGLFRTEFATVLDFIARYAYEAA